MDSNHLRNKTRKNTTTYITTVNIGDSLVTGFVLPVIIQEKNAHLTRLK